MTLLQRFAPIEIHHNDQTYSIRAATESDVPFLAAMQYEASLPPGNFSFWDGPLMALDVPTDTLTFIETVMRLNAGAWGSVDQFIVMEQLGRPIAAAAGIEPDEAFARGPVRISEIGRIGAALGWSETAIESFRGAYEAGWPDPQGNFLLLPQAPWIIESVAVIPEMRGQGLIKPLMAALFDEGKRRGHETVGITVANGNDRAQQAYEHLGFQMYVSFGPAFFGEEFDGLTKYKRALTD